MFIYVLADLHDVIRMPRFYNRNGLVDNSSSGKFQDATPCLGFFILSLLGFFKLSVADLTEGSMYKLQFVLELAARTGS